jgi:hypothetical protein
MTCLEKKEIQNIEIMMVLLFVKFFDRDKDSYFVVIANFRT